MKHGLSNTKFYRIYHRIKARCNNPKSHKFYIYGGRGIKCEWETFEDFMKDMYGSYQEHVNEYGDRDTQIDRIESSKNYCKNNCRWVTVEKQLENPNDRGASVVEYNGRKIRVGTLEKELGLKRYTLRNRLVRGWTLDQAINAPKWTRINK